MTLLASAVVVAGPDWSFVALLVLLLGLFAVHAARWVLQLPVLWLVARLVHVKVLPNARLVATAALGCALAGAGMVCLTAAGVDVGTEAHLACTGLAWFASGLAVLKLDVGHAAALAVGMCASHLLTELVLPV